MSVLRNLTSFVSIIRLFSEGRLDERQISVRKEVQEAVNETDDCDTPWSTFVPIVQECRLFPLPSLSLSPSLPRFLRVSLFRIAKTRYSLDRYAPRLSLFLASRTPTPRLCGRERSISRWNRGRTISTSLLHLFPPFFRPLLLLSHPLRNFC